MNNISSNLLKILRPAKLNLFRLFLFALVIFLIGSLSFLFDFINNPEAPDLNNKNLAVGAAGALVVTLLIFGLELYFRKLETSIAQQRLKEKELEAANRALKESREYLQYIINSSLDVIITVNEKREVMQFNRAAEKVFGYKACEILGMNAELLYQKQEEGLNVHKTILETGRYVGEIFNINNDGYVFPSFLSASMLRDNDGNCLGIMGISRDITEVKRAESALKKAATIDKLTQIYNRHTFEEMLERELERAQRYGSPLSLIMFDIDHFKAVNDNFGHITGDNVLRTMAGLVQGHIRKSDAMGRWGGEEFMILLPEKNLEETMAVADKLQRLIERHDFETVRMATASFGVTAFSKGDTLDGICIRVDKALYKAKNKGRNRVEYEEIG